MRVYETEYGHLASIFNFDLPRADAQLFRGNILDLSSDKVVYVISLEFAVGSGSVGVPIVPLMIFGIVLTLVEPGPTVVMKRWKTISFV